MQMQRTYGYAVREREREWVRSIGNVCSSEKSRTVSLRSCSNENLMWELHYIFVLKTSDTRAHSQSDCWVVWLWLYWQTDRESIHIVFHILSYALLCVHNIFRTLSLARSVLRLFAILAHKSTVYRPSIWITSRKLETLIWRAVRHWPEFNNSLDLNF